MRTILYLVRHGKTDWNDQGRFQGANDIPLNATGRSQAKAVARKLKSVPIHAVYSSPLSRAHETAREIAKHHSVNISIVDGLKETGFGVFEGLTWAEFHEHPIIKNRPVGHDRFTDNRGGGESMQQTYLRASKALDTIVSKHKDQTIVLVSHALLMKTLAYYMGIVDKEHIENLMIRNARPYRVEYIHAEKRYVPIDFPIEWRT